MSLSGHQRRQVWDAAALRSTPELLRDAPFDEEVLELPSAIQGDERQNGMIYTSRQSEMKWHYMTLIQWFAVAFLVSLSVALLAAYRWAKRQPDDRTDWERFEDNQW